MIPPIIRIQLVPSLGAGVVVVGGGVVVVVGGVVVVVVGGFEVVGTGGVVVVVVGGGAVVGGAVTVSCWTASVQPAEGDSAAVMVGVPAEVSL
jgi:hypothetical protein